MSGDKQIEEMAKALNGCTANCTDDCGCSEMEHAEVLYNAGYRKSADVAEEIFAEIDSLLEGEEKRYENLSDEADDPRFTNEYWEASLTISSIRTILAELKKKYTKESEGEKNGNYN